MYRDSEGHGPVARGRCLGVSNKASSGWFYSTLSDVLETAKRVPSGSHEPDSKKPLHLAMAGVSSVGIHYLSNQQEEYFFEYDSDIDSPADYTKLNVSVGEVLNRLSDLASRRAPHAATLADLAAAVPSMRMRILRYSNHYSFDEDLYGIFCVQIPLPETSEYDLVLREMSEKELKGEAKDNGGIVI